MKYSWSSTSAVVFGPDPSTGGATTGKSSSLLARRGDDVTLFCPSPTRQWFIWQNKTIINGGLQINPALPNFVRLTVTNNTTRNSIDLHIQSVTDIDVAVYKCTFTANNVDWDIQFSLYVKPDPIMIPNKVEGTSYIEGTEDQQLSMTCESNNGNPPADVTWKTGTTDLATNKNTVMYQFIPSRTNHLQMYTCVSNSAALSSPLEVSASLLLNLRPLSPVVTVSSVKEGGDIVAQCISTGSRPAAILSWFIDGELQSPTGQQQATLDTATQTYNVSLQFRKASSRSDNTKNLVCRANNTVLPGGIMGQQQMNVLFGPDSVTISGSSTLNENTVLSLTCNAALSNPQSTLTWYKNGSPFTVSGPVSTQNGDYGGKTTHQTYNTTVRRQDNGANITCVATSTAGSAVNSVILNVRYRPSVQIQPSTRSAIVGSTNVMFSCVVTDGNPMTASSYSWRKGGNQIGTGQTYTIQTVNRSHAGTYSCTGTNVAGTSDQATSTLVVLYPPVIATIPNQTPEEDSTLTVTCTVTSSNPAPDRIYWTRFNDFTFRQNSAVLSIPNISRTHTDNYTCHAENTMSPTSGSPVAGSDQMMIMVNVLYGPGTNVQFNPASSTISMEESNTMNLPTVRCTADCNPPCQYSWSGNTVSNDATLNLGIATRNKNGTYMCRARNTIGGNMRESLKELNVLIFCKICFHFEFLYIHVYLLTVF
ncbi:hypothetical protein FSP39_009369 [Pinctada imbricata]|uniref:Ig-like domain-containing protein n=1 Tax=Pinctada imbricata TaxID=66713 RepID=A0AA89C9U2_PINIB|nr:hypothetical protein FSP39_009369 [Pinctada imbricata]